ncbi:MAG: diguanylate cyclase [Acidimicrobiia bacterium]|nr:diguanylate cyclase [Acidimicrobiia bacterium]
MDLGTQEIAIFVSLVVVLGVAFVALVCDFLKGNNEQLRERNIELRVRQDERERLGLHQPLAWLQQLASFSRNPQLAEAVASSAAPAPLPRVSVSETTETAAPAGRRAREERDSRVSNWATPEELEQLAGRAARIRARHEAAQKQPEPAVPEVTQAPEPVAETPVVEAPVIETIEESVSFTSEPVAEEPIVAEEPVVAEEPIVETPLVEEPVAETPIAEIIEPPAAETPAVVEEPPVVTPEPVAATQPEPQPEAVPEAEPVRVRVLPIFERQQLDLTSELARVSGAEEPVAGQPAAIVEEPAAAVTPGEAEPELAFLSVPPGIHEASILNTLLENPALFSGVIVAIGINDFESLKEKLSGGNSQTFYDSLNRMLGTILRPADFACQFQEDEIILLFPGESGSSAQRRLFQVSEKLWDYQLRSLGHLSVIFSWGGMEVRVETLAEAVASARERMYQTKRSRKSPVSISSKKVVNG